MPDDEKNTETDSYLKSVLRNFTESYKFVNVDTEKYLALQSFTILSCTVLVISGLLVIDSLVYKVASVIVSATLSLSLIFYPTISYNSYRNNLSSEFPLFVTHITVLSMSNNNRIEVFREIARSDEYKAMSKEMNSLVSQIDNLNRSLEDATLSMSKSTPSDIMASFYEKLSYSVGAGQDLDEFLRQEQKNTINSFITDYEYRVKKIEQFANIFIGVNTSASFLIVISMVAPFLLGVSSTLVLLPVISMFVLIQTVFVIIIAGTAPKDYLWYFSNDIRVMKNLKIRLSLLVGVLSSIIIAVVTLITRPDVTVYLYPIFSVIPLILPSLIISREEGSIKNKEEQFASFMRSVGNIESVKQTSTANVLRDIKDRDFGTLSEDVVGLYNRLYLSVKQKRAWDIFSAKVGSNLIRSFSNMYFMARKTGADTGQLGKIISENFEQIKSLRKSREATISQLRGNVYGTGISMIAILIISKNIMEFVVDTSSRISSNEIALFNPGVYDFELIRLSIFLLAITNSILIGLLMRISQRKYIGGFVIHILIYNVLVFSIGYVVNEGSTILF